VARLALLVVAEHRAWRARTSSSASTTATNCAHYAKEGAGTSDIEYRFPFTAPGFGELEGIAHRADFDLKAHATHCGKGEKMRYFDQASRRAILPARRSSPPRAPTAARSPCFARRTRPIRSPEPGVS
jgi:hypothetical protein